MPDPFSHDPDAVFPLTEAASRAPRRRGGRKIHISTWYRWTSAGCRGVKLQYVQIGATRCTTRAWIDAFFTELTARSGGERRPPSEPPAYRRRTLEATDFELDQLRV